MKNLIALSVGLLGVSMLVHADTVPQTPQQTSPSVSVTEQPSPVKNEVDNVDNGSGDDIDTVDEGDPANDKDPEADDISTAPGKS